MESIPDFQCIGSLALRSVEGNVQPGGLLKSQTSKSFFKRRKAWMSANASTVSVSKIVKYSPSNIGGLFIFSVLKLE